MCEFRGLAYEGQRDPAADPPLSYAVNQSRSETLVRRYWVPATSALPTSVGYFRSCAAGLRSPSADGLVPVRRRRSAWNTWEWTSRPGRTLSETPDELDPRLNLRALGSRRSQRLGRAGDEGRFERIAQRLDDELPEAILAQRALGFSTRVLIQASRVQHALPREFLDGFGMRICIIARVVPAHGIGGMQDHTADLARGLVADGHAVELITARHPDGLREEEVDGVRRHYVEASPDDFTSRDWRERSYETFVRIDAAKPFDVVHGEGSSALELARRGTQRTTPLVVMFHGNFVGLVKASVQRQLRARSPLDLLREERGLASLCATPFRQGELADLPGLRGDRALPPAGCRHLPFAPPRPGACPRRPERRRRIRVPAATAVGNEGRARSPRWLPLRLRRPAEPSEGRSSRDSRPRGRERTYARRRPARHRRRGRAWPARASSVRSWAHERAVFTGAQPPERMPMFLAAADAFLFPTERDEAAPLVLPQAMACGLPVIALPAGWDHRGDR